MSGFFFNNNYINGYEVDCTIMKLCNLDTTPNEREMVETLAKHHVAFDVVDSKLSECQNNLNYLHSEVLALKNDFNDFKSTIADKISFIDKLFVTINSNPVLQTEWERFMVMLKLSVEIPK